MMGLALSILSLATIVAAADGNVACQSLTSHESLDSSNIVINIATLFENGTSFKGATLNDGYNIQLTDLPTHCRVAAQFNSSSESTVHFELWLPISSNWNRRFLAVGNGGWAGAINYPDVAKGLKQNFATMSTNTGHNSSSGNGTWLQFPEQSIDFGHRAMHLSTVHAKEIISSFYSTPPSWSYYMGCSTGGRQGFAEVQCYPEDFDEALVGCPVIWQTHLEVWENYVGIGQYPKPSTSFISTTQWTSIHTEALRQCDRLDGVRDGIISDPSKCNFLPETLLCQPTSNETTCLTPPQLENLKRIYGGWTDANNTLVFPGVPVGSELQGLTVYTNAATGGGFGLDFYKYAILNTTNFTSTDITYADVQLADKIEPYGALTDAVDPNLTPFQAHGGKILHYFGTQGSINNAGTNPHYYEKVLSYYSSLTNTSDTKVSDFYRMFMIPGLGHCQGGDGAWVVGAPNQLLPPLQNDTLHSALLALVEWREGSIAPDMLVGTKFVNETTVGDTPVNLTVKMTRPNCLWPNIPVYLGGDADEAESWACPEPLF